VKKKRKGFPVINPAFQSTERFQEIAANFNRTLQEMQRNSIARTNEAYTTFLAALTGTQHESQKQAQDALRSYSAAAQDAWCKPDAAKQHEQAYRNYIEMLSKAHEEAQKRHQEAVQMFAASLQHARDEARSQSIEAYRKYLQLRKETWANVDVDAIVAATAATVQSS
jgi:HD-GYP domain-containing protein (c-di-GMP phosphodiesterase class II)